MDMEKGKQRVEPASRETDPMDLETSAAVSGDNDTDRVITQPDDAAKKETDEAYLKSGTNTDGEDRNVKEKQTP